MNYKPSLPEHNDNVSHNKPLREFAILLGGLSLIFVAVYWLLGSLVDIAVTYIDPEDEALLFADFGPSIASDAAHDPQLQSLTDSLSKCAPQPIPATVYLQKNDIANAMALPGGTIVIYDGLFDYVDSENALAFVLAHELGHFHNRDHLSGMGRGIVLTVLAMLASGANSDMTQFLAPATSLSHAQYSQQREAAADAYALQLLNCHYGHIGGASGFFEQLLADQDLEKTPQLLHWFSSHPQFKQRIDAIHSQPGYTIRETKALQGDG